MFAPRPIPLNDSNEAGPEGADWQSRTSVDPFRRHDLPGAAGQRSCTFPLTNLALHEPQVPVAHSYGSAIPCRNAAKRIRSPGSAVKLKSLSADPIFSGVRDTSG